MSQSTTLHDPETVQIPPSERAEITSMATAFKEAVKAKTVSKESAKPVAALPATDAQKPAEQLKQSEVPKLSEAIAQQMTTPPELKGKARENFQNLEKLAQKHKGEAEALALERNQLKAELETARKGGPEHEQLKKELEQRDLLLKQFALEKHPQFQAHFNERVQSALSEAREAVGDESAGEVARVMQMPPSAQRDKQIEELAEALNLSDMRRIDLLDSYRSLKRTEKERQSELAKAPQNFQILQDLQARQAIAEQQKAAQNRAILLQHITAQIAPDLNGADPELAKSIQSSVADVVEGRGGAERYVQTVVNAAKWQRHQSTMAEQSETIQKLEAQLAELQTTQPSLSGAGATVKAKKGELEPIGDVFRRAMTVKGAPKSSYQPA